MPVCVFGGLDWQQDRWELPLSFSLFLWVHFGQFNNNLGEISKKKQNHYDCLYMKCSPSTYTHIQTHMQKQKRMYTEISKLEPIIGFLLLQGKVSLWKFPSSSIFLSKNLPAQF